MKKNNVLFVTHYSGMYGANKSMLALIIILRDKFNVDPIVLLRQEGPICEELDKYKIKYQIKHFYWWVNNNNGLFQLLLNIRKQLINLYRLFNIVNGVKSYEIDLVYSNSITISIGSQIARRLNVPHVWHIREGMDSYGFKFSLGNYISRLFLAYGADRYILISEYLYDSYQSMIPHELTCMIYNGITFPQVVREKNVPFDGIVNLCVVGLVAEQKNQMDALNAIKILLDKDINNIKLHIIGERTLAYSEIINSFIKENSLEEYVVMWGHQNDVISILKNMNIGLMTSHGEAFGRVTIEYMLKRIPVIASDSGANKEIIINQVNGLFYELFNPADLADKIIFFVNNLDQLEVFGCEAQKFAHQNFSAEQNAEKVYGVINDVLRKINNPYCR
jgi:glycosyltransferase involved in cell wall biosynthesis